MNTQPGIPRGIAVVAHDSGKQDMVGWATCNRATADYIISSPLLGDGRHAASSVRSSMTDRGAALVAA
jgi:methylglyoxal synthase